MKKISILIAVILLVVLAIYWRNNSSSGAKPTLEQITPVVQNYLSSGKTISCPEPVQIQTLSDVRVGDYNDQYKGWPVYASHQERCASSRITVDGLNDSTNNKALAFARWNGTQVEMFIPKEISDAVNLMQQQLKSIQ